MSNSVKAVPGRRTWRRLWKPALVTGGGTAAIVVWLDEVLAFAEDIIGVLLLPLMAGMIYLLDILMFRSRMPKEEDMKQSQNKGAKR